jgi:hypothetical protein
MGVKIGPLRSAHDCPKARRGRVIFNRENHVRYPRNYESNGRKRRWSGPSLLMRITWSHEVREKWSLDWLICIYADGRVKDVFRRFWTQKRPLLNSHNVY